MIKKGKNRKIIVLKTLLIQALFWLCASCLYAQEEPVAADTIEERSGEEYTDDSDSAAIDYFLNNAESAGSQEIHIRQLPDSVVHALRNDDAFWYANEDWNKALQKKDSTVGLSSQIVSNQRFFRNLMWIIIVCSFIAVLIWYLSISNAGIFRRRPVMIASEGDGMIYDDIFEINYSKEINKAITTGNYRLAIRLMFLQLLKNLSEKSIIEYTQDRTNFDYLLQLHQSSYYKDFFRLTRNYEYIWYGQFDINLEIFSSIRNDFENFNRRLV